ncbi:restriction endonuclease [Tenuibacillus multivorans]|uniref:Restriction system protein n=1 Tax=Tenuibacillus multivorans TaxID=237069 RepID=A0A1H0BMC1_9BACI|nr:restriction endonuclease [Tenuibacillus multivorans]GEL77110.1 restriction endonuclease [Tenuibacillus multivorans]SDN46774.1 restriction system protein [Tenuibacillus multivorans]
MKNIINDLLWGAIFFISILVLTMTRDLKLSGIVFIGLLVTYFIYQSLDNIRHNRKIASSGIREIDQMTGRQFEYYLSQLLQKKVYKVKQTKTTGDFGADLVLSVKNGEDIVVQAKRYNKKKVGISAVQEIFSSKSYYNATEAWVITSNYYTPAAIKLAKANKVKLINRDKLIEWVLHTK